MPTIKYDVTTTLSTVERFGALQKLVKQMTVVDIDDASHNNLMTALDTAGVPKYGDRLAEYPETGFELSLTERSAKAISHDTVAVELIYENVLALEGIPVDLDNPLFGVVSSQVTCSIQQKSSNLDSRGDQVVLEHTYADDDINFAGQTIKQGGEFQYFEAQRSFSINGIKTTEFPWLVANSIVGRVNYYSFNSEASRTWLCTACNWRPQGMLDGKLRYYFDFEFQFDPDTWDPTVVFIDSVTGKPPIDLENNKGIKTIQKLIGVNFEAIIGSRLVSS